MTCWEIFSGGKVPYSELTVRDIPKQLTDGYRLEKPSNDACSEEMLASYTMLTEEVNNYLRLFDVGSSLRCKSIP